MSTNLLILAAFVGFPGLSGATPVHPMVSQRVISVPKEPPGVMWGLRFTADARNYRIEVGADPRWATLAAGIKPDRTGIALPTSVNGGRPIRVTATFAGNASGVTLAPILDIVREQYALITMYLLFAGFFFAMALVNAMSWFLLRNHSNAWYAGLAASVATNMIFSSWGLGIDDGSALAQALVHALLVAAYLGCTVGFGLSLLRAMALDRLYAWLTIGIYGVNVVLLFCEDLFGTAWPLYGLDQAALDVLIVLLVVLGFRAMAHGGAPFARWFLIAFIGPVVGIPLNDLAIHHVIAGDWVPHLWEIGVAWEATFFAYAVTVMNRSLFKERDLLDTMAHMDALTGVANRRSFDETMAKRWDSSFRTGTAVSLLMIDIDKFKDLNDTRGHRYGDEVLRVVAKTCAALTTRGGDLFARYGGEEFGVILVGTHIEGAYIVAERMRAAVEATAVATVSVGVATKTTATLDSGALVAAADAALYRAKESGRNRVCIAEG